MTIINSAICKQTLNTHFRIVFQVSQAQLSANLTLRIQQYTSRPLLYTELVQACLLLATVSLYYVVERQVNCEAILDQKFPVLLPIFAGNNSPNSRLVSIYKALQKHRDNKDSLADTRNNFSDKISLSYRRFSRRNQI